MKIVFLNILLIITSFGSYANTYCVAPTGNDTNPGTETQPWATIQKAANTVVAGDTVFVKAGTYNERVIVQHSGTNDNYIVFSGFNNEVVTITGTGISWGASWNGLFDLSDKSYVKIQGFTITDADYAGIWTENSHHIIIENNYTFNTFSSGIGIWNSSYITIKNNEIELACNDGEQECITVANSNHCEVFENNVHNNGPGTNGGEGIDIKQGSYNIDVFKNEVHHLNNRLGIYTDAWDRHTHDINIYQNRIHHCSETGLAVASENGGLIENINIYNNIIYQNKYGGIELGDWSDAGFTGIKPIKHIKIINNTCYNNGSYENGWGFGIEIDNPNASDITIRNNICSRNSAQIAIQQIESIAIVDHNLFFGNNDASGTLYGTDSIIGNPFFVDTSLYNFHLLKNSPAIDNGDSLDAPTVDFDDISRPFGSDFDIGAYEYHSSSAVLNEIQPGILFTIFPNPCSDKFTVSIKGKSCQQFTLQLFDGKGVLLRKDTYYNVNDNTIEYYTDGLNSGLYVLTILVNNHLAGSRKLMVE